MSKELFVSSTPHETKVAVVEDDQLAEVYFERENEYTLAGSIYKGRVSRVLPGMQSAFVDVGLERDAFLYVTDFLDEQEDREEFEQVITRAHEDATRVPPSPAGPIEPLPPPLASAAPDVAAPEVAVPVRTESHPPAADNGRDPGGDRGWRGRRGRGRGRRGLPEAKFARQERPREETAPTERDRHYGPPPGYQPIILPGESISKYQHMTSEPVRPAAGETAGGQAPEGVALAASSDEEVRHEAGNLKAGFAEPAAGHAAVEATPAPPRETAVAVEAEDAEQVGRSQEPGEAAVGAPLPGASQVRPGPGPVQFAPGAGLIEEEEIEEEEGDLPPYGSELEDTEYEELEEETLQREAGTPVSPENGATVLDAVKEAAGERQALTGEVAEDAEGEEGEEENEEELEEEEEEGPEEEAEVMAEAEGTESEESGERAELRAPAAVAGYQQRSERAEEFRQRRGRRGGRRMRPRRNIQRGPAPRITDLLKEGQEILVQIAKEPMGKKGARITSHIALPGRFLVYMPTVNHIGVSRKISSEEVRQRLKRVIMDEHDGPGGFIVRTAAAAASDEDLRADIRFLLNLWGEIRQRSEASKAPALIYHDLNLVERILRDQVTQNFNTIWVDSEPEYERVLRFVNRFAPNLVRRVKLYTKDTPLFETFNIQEEINKALKSKVWLKSGGYIVINQTEALVAIDINTGKYVGRTTRLEDTIVKTNVDAIKEIVRQIRLRDLGGIIVIDFIDMDERKNRQKVMVALEEELKNDRAPSKVLAFNDFGLVAITRKRVKQSLERTLGAPCPYCTGTGLVKSVQTVCNEIYTEMRKVARQLERGDVVLRVNPEVAKVLKSNGARYLQEMEELARRTVIVKSDPTLHQEQYDIQ